SRNGPPQSARLPAQWTGPARPEQYRAPLAHRIHTRTRPRIARPSVPGYRTSGHPLQSRPAPCPWSDSRYEPDGRHSANGAPSVVPYGPNHKNQYSCLILYAPTAIEQAETGQEKPACPAGGFWSAQVRAAFMLMLKRRRADGRERLPGKRTAQGTSLRRPTGGETRSDRFQSDAH